MPMYKIIGNDGNEYGPIDAAGLRTWISQGRVHSQSLVRAEDGGQWQPLQAYAEFASLAGMPPVAAPNIPARAKSDDTVATIIPYRNPQALIAYYLGIFSLFPMLGFLLGAAAFILGIRGLMFVKRHPEAKGKVHAWIGIICGGLFGVIWLLVIGLMIIGFVSGRHSTR